MDQVADTLPHPRLIAVELRPFAEEATLIITPEGEMYQADAPPAEVGRVLALCDGSRPLEAVAAAAAAPESFAEILAALAETGCFSRRPPAPDEAAWARFAGAAVDPAALAATHALLLGDARLLALVNELELLPRFASATLVERAALADLLADADTGSLLVIALREQQDLAFLSWLDSLCVRTGVRWAQFHLDAGQGWLGPAVVPGYTARYRDLLVRRAAAADDSAVFDALAAAPLPLTDMPPLPPTAELVWMLACFCIQIERWLANAPCDILGAELRADPLTWQLTSYPLLPLPDTPLQGQPLLAGPPGPELLINERCGIITREVAVAHHPAVPAALTTVQLSLARMMVYDPTWHNDTLSGGSTFGDHAGARMAAIGEAAERYCGNYFPGARPLRASYNQLRARGEYALDPEQLVLFSEAMYRAPGFPFVYFSRDLPVLWVRGVSLTQGRPAWLPLQLVYVNWNVGGLADEPPISSTFYPGLAAGATFEQALAAGIQELVERDSMMVWWLNAQPLPALQLPPDLAALWQGAPSEHGQRAWAIPLPNEFGIPVVAGVVENTHAGLLNIGFACRPDPRAALLKAWTEALTLQEGSRDLLDPDGLTRQGVAWNIVPDVLRPWRADRRYLDDFRADFRDVADLLVQQQIFLDPRAIERVRPWVDLPSQARLEDLPQLPDGGLETLRERIERRGFEVFAIDLTTPDVALGGLQVARVLIPGLVPNCPAAFPPLGRERVRTAAVALGWRAQPLSEDALNLMPLPYA